MFSPMHAVPPPPRRSSRLRRTRSHKPGHPVRNGVDPMESQQRFGVHPKDFPGSVAVETDPGDLGPCAVL
jgi:hypothetical protein